MLSWWQHHGKHVSSYEELEKIGKGPKEGGRHPALDNRPAIFSGNEWLFDAWIALDSCRSLGMAVGPIPWTACDAYARRHDFDDDGLVLLWAIIHRADTALRAEAERDRPITGR